MTDQVAYNDGYYDGQNGRPAQWRYVANPSYSRGYQEGVLNTIKPMHRLYWPSWF